jgi:hypothetical protein
MKSPKPPDPYQTSAAQFQGENAAAQSSSIMNNPNIFTPYGSQTYDIAGWEQVVGPDGKMMSVPRYNQRQTLSPDQQILMGYETATQGNLGQTAVQQSAKLKDYLNKSIDTSKWQNWNAGPKAPTLSQNYRQDQAPTNRKAIEDAMMASYNRQADPRNEAEMAQSTARGAGYGTPIGDTTQRNQGDQFSEAVRQAYLASGNESRQAQGAYNQVTDQKNAATTGSFNLGGAAADRQNALRGMQAQQDFATRNQPINEIMALLGGSGVTMPSFAGYQGQGVNAPNIAGLIGQNYQQQSANANNFNAGLFGTAANLLGGWAGGGFANPMKAFG